MVRCQRDHSSPVAILFVALKVTVLLFYFFAVVALLHFVIKFVSFIRTGARRFRGQLDDQRRSDFLNLEQQPLTRKGRDKRFLRNMKLLSPPESFLSPNWSPGFWTILSLLYVGLMTTVVFFIQASLPSPMTLDDSVKTGDGSQRY